MKRLIIMRHAKSAWPDGVADHDRPLNKRGNRAAPIMAHLLVKSGFYPNAAIVSSSQRTIETWNHMNTVFLQNNLCIPMEIEPSFYLAGLGAIQRKLSGRTEGESLLILGHNYGWSDAVRVLSGRGIELKTANIAILEHVGATWSECIQDTNWRLVDYLTPRDTL